MWSEFIRRTEKFDVEAMVEGAGDVHDRVRVEVVA
jgi:hypothetical protein